MARWKEVVERSRRRPEGVIGGKSMGGRIASMVADEVSARGLVCLGTRSTRRARRRGCGRRTSRTLRTPTLIVQGTRDAFGSREEIATYALSPAIRIVSLEGGDHSFKPPARSGRTEAQNLAEAIAPSATSCCRTSAGAATPAAAGVLNPS